MEKTRVTRPDTELEKLTKFLQSTKTDFITLIRCFNFWNGLSLEEKSLFIEAHENREMNNIGGWY